MGNIWISSWRHCDWAGKLDLIVLLALSLISWAIMIDKFLLFRRIERENKLFSILQNKKERLPVFSASPLANIYRQYRRMNPDTINQSKFLEGLVETESVKLEKNLTFLATSVTISPVLGLLGTVWGLLLAFRNMGIQGATSIEVVGPGVAEALITTVAGLLVAIPAAVGYNYLITRVRQSTLQMENFIAQLPPLKESEISNIKNQN